MSVIENNDENNIAIRNNDDFFKLFQLQNSRNYFLFFGIIISYDKNYILDDRNNIV